MKDYIFLEPALIFGVILALCCQTGCNHDFSNQLAGKWEMTEYRINGQNENEDIKVFWLFDKNGFFYQSITYGNKTENDTAKWLKMNGDVLRIDYFQKRNQADWKIILHDDSLLKLEYKIPGFFVERSFKRK